MYRRDKVISALVRVRNEEEFLFPSVSSIADIVEEIVIVDNMSTDRTPEIIDALQREYPDKVFSYRYPFHVSRTGIDNAATLADQGRSSPHLLANFSNWCLKKCSKAYVLTWDGDMIATERFYDCVERWRASDRFVVTLRGANVHPDLEHLVGAVDRDPRSFESGLMQLGKTELDREVVDLAKFISSMTFTGEEPHIFPRFLARYHSVIWWEEIRSPFFKEEVRVPFQYRERPSTFLHLKFCKANPYANMSDDVQEMVRENVTQGPRLSQRSLAQLHAALLRNRAPTKA